MGAAPLVSTAIPECVDMHAFFAPNAREAKAISVRILNPFPGGNEFTSLYRARRFFEKKKAKPAIVGGRLAIEFVYASQEQAAEQRDRADRDHTRRVTGRGYDLVRSSFLDDARHIPIIDAPKIIRQERSSRDWSYTAAVTHSPARPHSRGEVEIIRTHRRALRGVIMRTIIM